MIFFSNCKINLGLHITGKRTDGYHNLETVFYPVQWYDAVEIIRNDESKEACEVQISGISINANKAENTCYKAYQLLKKDFPLLPHVLIHLHKTVPIGAGLGGGSANGAFTLLLLNQKFNLGLEEQQLLNYALLLGSDCPFFIKNKPCLAGGRGEDLKEISLDLSSYKIVIVNPGIYIPTAWAFSQIKLGAHKESIDSVISQPIQYWKEGLVNDFEKEVFVAYPPIHKLKETLYGAGALYASMTGSGATVFGIFEKEILFNVPLPTSYLVKEC